MGTHQQKSVDSPSIRLFEMECNSMVELFRYFKTEYERNNLWSNRMQPMQPDLTQSESHSVRNAAIDSDVHFYQYSIESVQASIDTVPEKKALNELSDAID